MRKLAVCGLSNRALKMFMEPVMYQFSQTNQIVGLLDIDPRREEICMNKFPELIGTPFYTQFEQFDEMIKTTGANTIIVTGRDDSHVDYIVKGLEHDLDVITEKPMVTTVKDAKRVMEAEGKSKGKVTVAFNYRYSPYHRKIRELIADGKSAALLPLI